MLRRALVWRRSAATATPSSGWRPQLSRAAISAQYDDKPVYFLGGNASELRRTPISTTSIVRIDRFAQNNTLTEQLCDRISAQADSLNRGKVTTFFILRGTTHPELQKKLVPTDTDNIFSAGADWRALYASWQARDVDAVTRYFKAQQELVNTLVNVTKPWAAGLDGLVMGAGVGLSMHALFRFAAPQTIWAIPETSFGAVPGYGATFELPRLPNELGTYLALTGRRIVGHDVFQLGLASHYIDPDAYPSLCEQISKQHTAELEFLLPVLDVFDDATTSLRDEPCALTPAHLETIAQAFRHNSVPRIIEELQSESSEFAKRTLRRLKERSPAALAITLRLLREGARNTDVVEALRVEHAVMMRLWNDSESDLHAGLSHLYGEHAGNVAAKPTWRASTETEAIERLFAAPSVDAEVLNLQPLLQRPAYEAAQLLQHAREAEAMSGISTEEDDPPKLIDHDAQFRTSDLETSRIDDAAIKKILIPTPRWLATKLSSAEIAEREHAFGSEWMRFATVVGMPNRVPVPAQILAKAEEEFGDLKLVEIFRVDEFDVHTDLDMVPDNVVQSFRAAIRDHFKIPEPSAARQGVLTDMSSESLLSTRFLDMDEEAEAYMRIMGFKVKTLEEQDKEVDQIPNYDGVVLEVDERPLSLREQKL